MLRQEYHLRTLGQGELRLGRCVGIHLHELVLRGRLVQLVERRNTCPPPPGRPHTETTQRPHTETTQRAHMQTAHMQATHMPASAAPHACTHTHTHTHVSSLGMAHGVSTRKSSFHQEYEPEFSILAYTTFISFVICLRLNRLHACVCAPRRARAFSITRSSAHGHKDTRRL
jgi:hypothetical protein